MRALVTGNLGFIGSNLTMELLRRPEFTAVVGFDAETYAARPAYLERWLTKNNGAAGKFKGQHRANLLREEELGNLLISFSPDVIFHLAAESHVCRSIEGPKKFLESNTIGTFNLLEQVRLYNHRWGRNVRIVHVSTDEVFGELGPEEMPFDEFTQIDPRSPYAASKAASDMFALSYRRTFDMDVRITNCSNNFGPNQHEEKLIPKTILRILKGKPITLYGNGLQVRDWIWVGDHVNALIKVALLEKKQAQERYCIGGDMELKNVQVVTTLFDLMMKGGLSAMDSLSIKYTDDRPTDDLRYAINNGRINADTGWEPDATSFRSRLLQTIKYYADERGLN